MNPFIAQSLSDLAKIVLVPFKHPELLWQIAPIFCMWLLIEFYFGTHKKEKLGWNTSLANGMSLFWIVVSGMQFMFSNLETAFSWDRFIVILLITIYAIFIMIISFKHTFSNKVTYILSSPSAIYFFAFASLIYAFGIINAKWTTITALIIFYLCIVGFASLLKKLLPEEEEDDNDIEQYSSKKKEDTTFDFSSDEPSSDPFGNTSSDPFASSSSTSSKPPIKDDFSDFKF